MNRIIPFILALSLSFANVSLAQTWDIVQRTPSVLLLDLQIFPDGENGWAVGSSSAGGQFIGAVLKTTDGGENWDVIDFPFATLTDLTSLHFVDTQTGWVVGENGKIFHTADGGNSWSQQVSGTTRDLASVHFIDENTGWAAGGWQDGSSFLVLKTTNGGETWEDQSFGDYAFSVGEIFFLDENTGWIGGRKNTLAPHIHRTDDGGQTWVEQPLPLGDDNIDIPSIEFTSKTNGWAATSSLYALGNVLHTADGGNTWEIVHQTGLHYHRLDVQDSLHVAIAAVRILSPASERIEVTQDGGQTWNSYVPPYLHYTYGIQYEGDEIWIAGEYSAILKSGDNGLNWDYQHYAPLLKSIDWSDNDNGWTVAGYVLGARHYCARSENGGQDWSPDWSIPGGSDIRFLDDQTGFMLDEGNAATFRKTTNGGQSWVPSSLGTSAWTEGFTFVNANEGYAFGSNGNLRKTVNGGGAWAPLQPNVSDFIQQVFFLNETTGWAVGGFGSGNAFILYTDDGGDLWQPQPSALSEQILDIFFINENVGWSCTVGGKIQKTTNGGWTWEFQNQVSHDFAEAIFMMDENTGYLIARNKFGSQDDGRGFIYRTDDGGTNWFLDWAGAWPNSSISEFRMKPDQTSLWAVGDHNTILELRLVNSQITTSPADVKLQAFPSPFQEELVVQFELPKSAEVRYQIFQTDGRLVWQSGEQHLPAGPQQLSWNGQSLNGGAAPAGMYLCQLIVDGKIYTTKVVKQ
jgi:photosystem II stability/assembly factor-like uncharacterized protein